jgi:hypothetical protein
MPWQLHSRTAFTTVSWFYVALTPRRQRKQKMKRMKPTMAITFHMRALRVAATSLNQKSDTFIPTECGTFVCYCRSSYCCKLLATQFLGLKVLRLPNAEISDFLLRPWKIGNHKKKLDRAGQRNCFPGKNHKRTKQDTTQLTKTVIIQSITLLSSFSFLSFSLGIFSFFYLENQLTGTAASTLSLSLST